MALLIMSSFAIPSFASSGTCEDIQVTDSSSEEVVKEEEYSFSERILKFGTSDIKEDGKLYVIMEHEYSDLGKTFDASYFPELDIESIKDISGANDENATREDFGERWADFRNVISITLKNKTVDDMIDAVKKLDHRAGTDLYSVTVGYNNIEFVSTGTPIDPKYSEQSTYYDLIDLPEAWDITTGSSNVKVAVIEHQIFNHDDIDDNLITGYDFINNEIETNDYHTGEPYHGVAVAGVLGAKGNNPIGYAGVCWDVSMVPIQTDLSNADMFSEVLKYLMDNGIKIINCSQEGAKFKQIESSGLYELLPYFVSTMKQQINNYTGILICSAGNDGVENEVGENITVEDLNEDTFPAFPASFDCHNIISVGASTNNDAIWYNGPGKDNGSNWGVTTVDLFAPGKNIYSMDVENGYACYEGTSFAAPIVSGVAALMMSANPDLTPLQIKAILLNTVDRKTVFLDKCVSGGRINAYEAVRIAHGLYNNNLIAIDQNKADYLFHASTNTIVKYVGTRSELTIPASINEVDVQQLRRMLFRIPNQQKM